MDLDTNVGTRIDKTMTMALPFVGHDFKNQIMLSHMRFNFFSKRQAEALEELL